MKCKCGGEMMHNGFRRRGAAYEECYVCQKCRNVKWVPTEEAE